MIEQFSSGYYKTSLTVQEYSDGPTVSNQLYTFIKRNIYQQTDAPPLFKMGLDSGAYFTVNGENSIPSDVIALPEEWIIDFDITENNKTIDIFICKPEFSHMLQQGAAGGKII